MKKKKQGKLTEVKSSSSASNGTKTFVLVITTSNKDDKAIDRFLDKVATTKKGNGQ